MISISFSVAAILTDVNHSFKAEHDMVAPYRLFY